MRLVRAGARARWWLAAGIVGAGLLAGGAWCVGKPEVAAAGLLGALTRPASAREVPAPPQTPAEPNPSGAAATNSKRPTGQVSQLTAEPASFTMQTADGTPTMYRVLDTTVFMAGRDRPYRFDLLKVGDTVIVRGGGRGRAQAGGATQAIGASNARGRPTPARTAGVAAPGESEPVARLVMVRPAGEQRGGKRGRT